MSKVKSRKTHLLLLQDPCIPYAVVIKQAYATLKAKNDKQLIELLVRFQPAVRHAEIVVKQILPSEDQS